MSIYPATGIVLDGKYRLMGEIGRGTKGVVFAAQDIAIKQMVAVKFLLPMLADSSECVRAFKRGALAMAAVHDTNVVRISGHGDLGPTPYFAMELLGNNTVQTIIDRHRVAGSNVPLADAYEIMLQSLKGLHAIHTDGMIHRDIKPANIIVSTKPMRAVITDFGMARVVRAHGSLRVMAGTPAYVAPELLVGEPASNLSPLCDIYSMGVVAYQLFTGTLPFKGGTWIDVLHSQATNTPVLPSDLRPDLPGQLDRIIMQALSKEPAKRFPSARDFLFEIFEAQKNLTPSERRTARLVRRAQGGSQVERVTESRVVFIRDGK